MTDPRAYTGPQLKHVLTTYTGKLFNLRNPDPATVCLEDIAHALSHSSRYNGHLPGFYSIAQHSVYVMQQMALLAPNAPPKWLLAALLHDAAEAYVGDMVAPLKALIPEYGVLEELAHGAVYQHFGLPAFDTVPEMDALIHEADMRVFAGEWVYLARRGQESFANMRDPTLYARRYRGMEDVLKYWAPETCEIMFKTEAQQLIDRIQKVGAK